MEKLILVWIIISIVSLVIFIVFITLVRDRCAGATCEKGRTVTGFARWWGGGSVRRKWKIRKLTNN